VCFFGVYVCFFFIRTGLVLLIRVRGVNVHVCVRVSERGRVGGGACARALRRETEGQRLCTCVFFIFGTLTRIFFPRL